MKRIPLLYVAMLLIAAAAIAAVLRLGSALPAPEGVASTAGAATESLGANLGHPVSRLFLQLLVILVASRAMGKLFTRLGQPAVVGEMAAGILIGPSLFGLLAPGAFAYVFPTDSLGTLRLLSQIGVCLFMFAVGMELDLEHLRGKARATMAVSHAGIVVPYLLGVVLAYFLYGELAGPGASFTSFALFLGICMSITAFPVLARILQDRGMSKTLLGSTAITCAAIADVTAWIVLAFVVAIAGAASLGGAGLSLLLTLVFTALMLVAVRPVLARWQERESREHDEPSPGTLAVVMCVVIASALATEAIGIHALFGAFLAGVILPDVRGFRGKIGVRVESFSAVVLLPLFFAFTGLRTQIRLLADVRGWLLCLAIVAVATLGKLGGSAVAARATSMSWSESLQLGALMNTRGLMELIALNIGYELGILPPRIFAMLVIMALATTMLTGPLLTFFGRLDAGARRADIEARERLRRLS